MKLASPHRKAYAWALALGCALAFVRCSDDQVAGSSVTTGNPTEIQVSLTDAGGGPAALSGRVEIYAATQIPVPGFRPDPLARFDVGADTFTLNAGHFEGIADSLWAKGSLEGDSLAKFNLVIIGADKGAILSEMAYRLKDAKFSLKDGAFKAGTKGGVKVAVSLQTLTQFQATLTPSGLSGLHTPYMFLPGTGFAAKGAGGKFDFPALPSGIYRPSFLELPTPASQIQAPQDSINIHALDLPLVSGSNSVSIGDIHDRVPVPAELRK